MSKNTGEYTQAYGAAAADPTGFWAKMAADIHRNNRWDKAIDDSNKLFYR